LNRASLSSALPAAATSAASRRLVRRFELDSVYKYVLDLAAAEDVTFRDEKVSDLSFINAAQTIAETVDLRG
jgi:hypothetical protein